MLALIKILKNKLFSNQVIKPLGRWKIDYCDKKMNRKIDMSNEDHCGPCGQYQYIKDKKNIVTDNYVGKD